MVVAPRSPLATIATVVLVLIGLDHCKAFQLQTSISSTHRTSRRTHPPTLLPLSRNNHNDEDPTPNRFLSPQIDDAGLPLTDGLLAQIVAPSLQVFFLSATHAPAPTWLAVRADPGILFPSPARQRGGLLAPVLVHGAGLAVCWIAGALAARGYESDAFDVGEGGERGYGEVVRRVLKAGSFATGLLVVGTQLDLLLEFGRFVQLGESDASDVRLVCAGVEVVSDVLFEAVVLGGWRLYRASLTADRSGRP